MPRVFVSNRKQKKKKNKLIGRVDRRTKRQFDGSSKRKVAHLYAHRIAYLFIFCAPLIIDVTVCGHGQPIQREEENVVKRETKTA